MTGGSSCPNCGAILTSRTATSGLCGACLLATASSSDEDHDPYAGDWASTDLAAGTMVGAYRIVKMVGRGGMATVYEALDTRLDRAVALKVLPPEFLHDRSFAMRFEQEARIIARLEHPNIVPIY